MNGDHSNAEGMAATAEAFLDWLRLNNYSDQTIEGRRRYLGYFIVWCDDRGINRPSQVTKRVMERYRWWLYHYRKKDGKAMAFSSQRARLAPLKAFFRWLVKIKHIRNNPTSELEMPRQEQRLPRNALSAPEADRILNKAGVHTAVGIRDRAILEVLYSTGMRRMELINLHLCDVDSQRCTMMIRMGKGRKDRLVPIGKRALWWLEKYLREVRFAFAKEPDHGSIFLTRLGAPLTHTHLSRVVRQYIDAAGVTKAGSCHLFRHTMATLMLEHGADIRYIQQMLGHSELSTTAIYTRVSIRKLRQVHARTHPAKMNRPPEEADQVASDCPTKIQ